MGQRTRSIVLLACLSLVTAAAPSAAHAKDNSQYVAAIGFQANPVGPAVPAALLSVKFSAAPTAEFAALLGFTLADGGPFSLAFGGKALLVLVPEKNLNLYLTATVLPSVGTGGFHSLTYFVGPGVEYYPPGASDLEVFAEFGIGGAVRLGTGQPVPGVPVGPVVTSTGSLTLGLHYWF